MASEAHEKMANLGQVLKEKVPLTLFSKEHTENRYSSFAPQRSDNVVRWYVDGCSYMWAVSVALERATTSIWILDWWLSPELYLRRPPSQNENYRLDRMLYVAAERGVKIKIIVYKEVTQALTLSSSHTKHHLEDLHPNIAVFRHPDHLPDRAVLSNNFMGTFKQLSLRNATSAIKQWPGETFRAIKGDGASSTILYWAHHEKLCVIDDKWAFLGGLDLCYGRWDTHQHSIADFHVGEDGEDRIIFPGQDYNNARFMDFHDVANYTANKLDRSEYARMGWSDVGVGVGGPAVYDARQLFIERWNFIMKEKYRAKNRKQRYEMIADPNASNGHGIHGFHWASGHVHSGAMKDEDGGMERNSEVMQDGKDKGELKGNSRTESTRATPVEGEEKKGLNKISVVGRAECQIVRSCGGWSNGSKKEQSIANAYCELIESAERFIYIENQFFITSTGPDQGPVRNRVGEALVNRIIRAAKQGEEFVVIVVIPSVPAFAGDLSSDEALSTRAIMEFQYGSICRDQLKRGNSIYERLAREGIEPIKWIRFYNLRSFDRLACREGDGREKGRWDSVVECYMGEEQDIRKLKWYGMAIDEMKSFVSEQLYVHSKVMIIDDRVVIMGSANLNDRSLAGDHDSEIAMVIEDDTPCPEPVLLGGKVYEKASRFATSLRRTLFRKHLGLLKCQSLKGKEEVWEGTMDNGYDWGSEEDKMVMDVLSGEFKGLWSGRAEQNTLIFRKIFHAVPDDTVRNWQQYKEFYGQYFGCNGPYKVTHVVEEEFGIELEEKGEGRGGRSDVGQGKDGGGGDGAKEEEEKRDESMEMKMKELRAIQATFDVKELLSKVRGTLVEMPLMFLKDEDIAREGLGLNMFTQTVYT